jgi:hypothetical protein
MASREHDESESFLSRWSQRKRAAEESPPQEAAKQEGSGKLERAAAAEGPAPADPESIDPKDLPDIDSLDATSDFSVFLKKGVPQALQRRALRKLWQVDPAFSEICMLDDYNLDYTDAATVVPNMKTLFQVGRGMIMPGEDDADDAAGDDAAGKVAAEAEAPPAPEAAASEGEAEAGSALAAERENATLPAPAAAPEATPTVRRDPRKPRGPLVSGAATPRSEASRPAPRSARERRWGDPDKE